MSSRRWFGQQSVLCSEAICYFLCSLITRHIWTIVTCTKLWAYLKLNRLRSWSTRSYCYRVKFRGSCSVDFKMGIEISTNYCSLLLLWMNRRCVWMLRKTIVFFYYDCEISWFTYTDVHSFLWFVSYKTEIVLYQPPIKRILNHCAVALLFRWQFIHLFSHQSTNYGLSTYHRDNQIMTPNVAAPSIHARFNLNYKNIQLLMFLQFKIMK